jgi:hypothetical protein
MKIVTNEKLVKRNGRIGQIATITGLLVLVGGMVLTFRNPNYAYLSWIALILGFGFSQIGLSFSNRWGRHPRPDELIDQGLKGLNDQYSIYHYSTPAAHLLVGPSGLWVILPYYQTGTIVYEKNRWKQKGGGFMQRYLRIFGQEGLGKPDLEASEEIRSLERFFTKNMPEFEFEKPNVVIVFVNERADLQVEDAPILTLPVKQLKNTIRKSAKSSPFSPELINQVNGLFAQ